MCVTVPGLVVELVPLGAVVDIAGRRSHALTTLVPDVAIGDWVLVNAGVVAQRLDPEQADEILRTLADAAALADAEEARLSGAPSG